MMQSVGGFNPHSLLMPRKQSHLTSSHRAVITISCIFIKASVHCIQTGYIIHTSVRFLYLRTSCSTSQAVVAIPAVQWIEWADLGLLTITPGLVAFTAAVCLVIATGGEKRAIKSLDIFTLLFIALYRYTMQVKGYTLLLFLAL